MKSKRNLFICVLLGAVLGWMLGYLHFPDIGENTSFWFGFILCFAILLLLLYVTSITRSKPTQNVQTAPGRYAFKLPLLVIIVAATAIIFSVRMYKKNAFLTTQLNEQKSRVKELSEIIETAGSGKLSGFMNTILVEAVAEMKTNRKLSDSTINKIASLSFSFKPYKYFEGDSLSEKKMSPERGQLLLAILMMDIDSGSFSTLKSKVTFSGANLNGADLHGADLSNADLQGAYFKEANLSETNLSGADLSDANLWGANMNKANLSGSDLKRSELSWAVLNESNLKQADLNGAKMQNAQFISADLTDAKMQWANAEGAIFHQAHLENTNLMGSSLNKVNLNEANLNKADLRLVRLNDANLSAAEINKAIVDSTWVDSLNTWRVTGSEKILRDYEIIEDTLDQWKNPMFRLNKIEEEMEKVKIDSITH